MTVITEDMILRPGRLFRTPVCWNCRHRIHYTPRQIARLPTRPYEHCVAGYVTDWHKVRVCNRNPIGIGVHGDAGQFCGLWELDDRVWHSPREQVYEFEMRRRRAAENGGQADLRGWR